MNVAEVHTNGSRTIPDLRKTMERDGYVSIPNVLSTHEIGALRRMVRSFCDAGKGTYYQSEMKANVNVFASEPEEITHLLAHPGIARIMKEIIGHDPIYMRELGVSIGGSSGWHKDTHSLERSVRGEHDGYEVYKLMIYPQDHVGLDEADFALKVRKGSHWIPDATTGEVDTLFVRAGDILVIDCRTSHRGRQGMSEGAGVVRRALNAPFYRGVGKQVAFEVRDRAARMMKRQQRQLITLLYGRRGHFADEYMRQGRSVVKKRFPHLDVDQPLPESWKRALDSVGIGY